MDAQLGSRKTRVRRKPRTRKPRQNSINEKSNSESHHENSSESSKIILKFSINRAEMFAGTFIRRHQHGVPINLNALVSLRKTSDLTINRLQQLAIAEPSSSKKTRDRKRSQSEKGAKTRKRRPKNKEKDEHFTDYATLDQITAGLKSGDYVKGLIRINPKNFKEAYITNYDTSKADYVISSVVDRNQAFDGDEVVLQVSDRTRVIFISKKNHSRTCVGYLKTLNDEFAEFQARDTKIPKVKIPRLSWPSGFSDNPKNYQEILFLAKINEWTDPNWALGTILETLGQSYDLKIEALAILKEFSLEISQFDNHMPSVKGEQLTIPPSEYLSRLDFTKECVFTIDPLTAKDLDDAVSCKTLPNGNHEIAVHISDVSYYLSEMTDLDLLVRRQATTIYMVDKAYHMLPFDMCQICSLLPGKDKLAFSVIWEMTNDGDVVATRFARTVINSCCQLAYEHAQSVIDDDDSIIGSVPKIYNNFTIDDIKKIVKILYKLSLVLRNKRIENGALRIDQIKVNFHLDPVTNEPLSFDICESKEANRLIEEFMLLANISVAEEISKAFPDLAFLRLHEPPKATMMNELQKVLETVGIHVDISTSKTIQMSLAKSHHYENPDFLAKSRMAVINHLFAKPMTRARYFCQGQLDNNDDVGNAVSCHHYALSVPLYTHFTSPIRRYADIMVHRLLAASLNYRPPLDKNWTADQIGEVAANCNLKKYNAKRAGEACSELYLAHYVNSHQPFIETAVVVDVKERSIDVIVLATGTVVRLYNNDFEGAAHKTEEIKCANSTIGRKLWRILVTFPQTPTEPAAYIVLEMFTLVTVALTRKPRSYKLQGKLLRPRPIAALTE